MHTFQAHIGLQLGYRRQIQHAREQRGELFLARLRHQKIPKRAKTLALVGFGNRIALTHDGFQQLSLGPVPQGNALTHRAIQRAKVVLHLPKIRQQLTRQAGELLKAVFERGVVQQGHVALHHPGNFCVDGITLFVQLGDAGLRIGFTAIAHLFEQTKQREQARLGANKGPV
ncbi:hypothetical protein GALL_451160 [mine drainage metagenome]|uniref:Uncharacterized protein n=1 Tax=mine drainage metagenome TaxID=410659 RepID=A0A1J5PQ35_9ZZZZ